MISLSPPVWSQRVSRRPSLSPSFLLSSSALPRSQRGHKSSDSASRKVKCSTVHTFPPRWPQMAPLFPPCKIAFLEILQHRRSTADLTHLGTESGLSALCLQVFLKSTSASRVWRIGAVPQAPTGMFILWKNVTSKNLQALQHIYEPD